MNLNSQDQQILRDAIAKMKADRVPIPQAQAMIDAFIKRKQAAYAAQPTAPTQKEKKEVKENNTEIEQAEAREKERVAKLGYTNDFHPDNVKTWVNKDEDQMIAELKKLYPRVDFTAQASGSGGNELVITGTGEPSFPGIKINLNPNGEADRQKAVDQFNVFNQWAKGQQEVIKKNGIGMNLFTGVDTQGNFFVPNAIERDDLARANKGYNEIGINVFPLYNQKKGKQQLYGISKDGVPIEGEFDPQELQQYLSNRDNYTEEQRIKFSEMAHEAAVRQNKIRKNIQQDPQYSVDMSLSKANYAKSKQKYNDVKVLMKGASEEDIKVLNNYLNKPIVSDDGEFEPVDNWEQQRVDTLFSDEVRNSLSPEGQAIFDKAKENSEEQFNKSISKQNLLDNEKVWNAEYAERLREGDDQLIVRYNGRAGIVAVEGEDGEVKVENLYKQKESINTNLDNAKKDFKTESDEDYRYAIDIFKQAKKDGVTVEVKKDEKGMNMYIAKGNNAEKYQPMFNKIRKREKETFDKYNTTITVESNRYKNWLKTNQEHSKIQDVANREGDIGNIMLDQFNSACASIGYSVPILFGSENAINMHQSRQAGADAYEAVLDYNTSLATGQKGRYSLITLSQQAPNVMLAVATQGVGTAFGAGATVASAITASAFGLNSGTSKYADLTIQAGAAEEAKRQLEMLELNKDYMDYEDYINTKANLEEQKALGDMSSNDILKASIAAGVIEGGVAFALGTIPNASKLMKGIIGTSQADDILAAVTKKNFAYYAGVAGEGIKRTGGEVVEESLIHLGDMASESIFLDRDMDLSEGWSDVIAASVLTGGAMNGPSLAYSSIMQRMNTSDNRKVYFETKDQINKYKNQLKDTNLTQSDIDLITYDLNQEKSKLATLTDGMEMTGMLMGAKGLERLMKNGMVMDQLNYEAGVTPGDSQAVIDKKVKEYSDSLKGDKKKSYDNRLADAKERRQKLLESVDYKDGHRAWGSRGTRIHNRLMKTDADYKKMNDQQRATKVHQEAKRQIENKFIKDAKKDKGIKAMVETQLYGGVDIMRDKRRTKQQREAEDEAYLRYGRLFGGFKAEAISRNIDQEINAKSVLGDKRLEGLQIVQVSDKGFVEDIRQMEENGELNPDESADDIIAEVESGESFGVIVGGKYIVTDAKAAAKNLKEGNLTQGTVFSHEVKHATDAKAFDTQELIEYSGNLAAWTAENAAPIHVEAMQRLQGNKHLLYDKNGMPLPWEQQPKIAHQEYGNYVQDAIQRKQYKKYKDKLYSNKPTILQRAQGLYNADFKTDTPTNAAAYLADHMKSFDKGEVGKLTKRRIDKRKGKDLQTEDGRTVKRSSNLQGVLEQGYKGKKATKADVKAMLDNMLKVDYNGEPMTGDANQVSALEYEIGGIMNDIAKRLFDPISIDNRKGVTRKDYIDSLFSEAVTMIQNEYDPSKQSLDAFVSNRLNLRANSLAERLGIDQVFTTDLDNANRVLTDDDTDINLDDDRNIVEGTTDFTDGLALTPEGLKTVLDEVQLTLGGILPSITAEKGKNATVSPLVSELKKKFYAEKNPIQQTIEAAMGKTPQEIEMFLKNPKNKALILKHMPTTWLAKNMPKAVQKLVIQEDGTKVWTTDHVGRTKGTKPGQVDFYRSSEEGPYKGMTDGKQKIRRNPKAMTDITSVDIIKKFFNGTTMTELRRGGLDTLTRAMAQEIGLEQFRANMENDSDIANMFKSRQELLYGVQADNLTAQAIEQVERGVVLRSKESKNLGMSAFMNGVAPNLEQVIQTGVRFGFDSKAYRDMSAMLTNSSELLAHIEEQAINKGITKENIGLIQNALDSADVPSKIKDAIKEGGYRLRNKDKKTNDNAVRYNNAIKNFVDKYNIDQSFINSLGGVDVFGYFSRALDSAMNSAKYDGKAPFADDRAQVMDMLVNEVTGYVQADILPANKSNRKLVDIYSPILHSEGDMQAALDHLDTVRDKISAANTSNIGHLKYLIDKLNEAYKAGDISGIDLFTFFQTQTNIVKGIRALSAIEYFMQGNFIDTNKFKNIKDSVKTDSKAYNAWVDKLSKFDFYAERMKENTATFKKKGLKGKALKRAAHKATYADLTIKGEHLAASGNTNSDLFAAIVSGKYNDQVFADIVEDHTQFFGPKFVMDKILDTKLGRTSREGHRRLTLALPKNILDRVVHVSGKPAAEVVLLKEAGIKVLRSKENIQKDNIISKALEQKYLEGDAKGISVLDFDDTLATSKSLVEFTRPDGTTGTLTPAEYAAEYENLADLGYKFDFSQFNKVIDGKIAPLFEKAKKLAAKFGTNDIFILTARPPAAQKAIHKFLKDNGLNIPIENITGLGNSTAEAKALWVADKAAEGYNDFYFADDALKNVQAVKNILDQFDVKSKVRQARTTLRSKADPTKLNEMISRNLGIAEYKDYSDAKAKLVGGKKGKWKFFIPPSAEDFKGLLYPLLGKGAKGDADMQFFKDALFDPYSRGMQQISNMAQGLSVDLKNLNKAFPKVKKKLKKKIPGTEFTYDQGLRVYMWDKAGVEIPGISEADKKAILKEINKEPELQQYADSITKITKSPSYIEPTNAWLTSSIPQDLHGITMGENRTGMLTEFIENRKKLFGDWQGGRLNGPLMNKLEAALGTNWRDAMEDILWRMENGSNRNFGTNKLTNQFTNWVNNSVGAIMFFNGRSAVLQTLSTVNFINWSDNNPIKAAAAFANQKQFWKDFTFLFNSDMLKQRRAGNRRSVSESEIAQAYKNGGVSGLLQKLLEFGFLPTQIADSFAIASGGATFYRNRVKSLIKSGMSQADAEAQAFTDFQKITEETQQSSRPDMISSQQASPLGRLILAFQNTPMQYARLTKKAFLDLKNGRGDAKTNISKILYYGAAQNLIFGALQQALFRFMFDDDEEKTEGEKQKEKERATFRLVNGSIDSILRGIGVAGAIASTLKNMIIKFAEEDKKGFRMDTAAIIMEMLQLSPPVGSKVRKVNTGLRTYKFKRREIDHMDTFDIDNPIWSPVTQTISALTNIPTDRLYKKIMNLREVGNSNNDNWQRIALLLGWNTWDVGVRNQEVINARGEIEEIRRQEKEQEKEERRKEKERLRKEKEAREVQCSAKTRKGKGPRCKNRTENKSGKCYAHQ
tara:strand:- start:2611 stop:11967 length:9357 start_codon:yes stop_codon:yes gene_type:complete